MFKLYLDPGHGGKDPGAVGNGLQEKNVALTISKKIRDILATEYEGVAVKMSRTGDTFPTLKRRTDEANDWGADYFMSVHINSFSADSTGFETLRYPGSKKSQGPQSIIHDEIAKVIGLRDRGKKELNVHVLRASRMPAILTENGFISNPDDAAKMKDNAWLDKVARGHVNGLVKAFGLKRKSTVSEPATATTNGELYRVQVFAGSKSGADKMADKLKKDGYPVFIVKQ